MSEWRKCKLGDICEVFTGYPFKGEKYEPSGNLRVVRGENVTIGSLRWDSEKHWNHSLDGLEQYFLNSNDIVIGMDGSRVGQNRAKIRVIELPLILAQRVARLRAQIGFDQCFLWYLIFDNRFKEYVDAIHTGTSIPHISTRQIADFEITCPPIPKQKAIATVLSSLDDKIDLLHRQNKTLEAMAETLFRQWFVVDAREDWEEGTLADISLNIRNLVKVDAIQGNCNYIGLEHIDRRNIALKECGLGSDVNSNKYAFSEKDILFGKLRPYFHKVCFAPFSGICSTDILVIRPIKKEWFCFGLFAFFQNDVVEFTNLGSGGTRMPRTDWETLKTYPITIPDIEAINQFNNLVLPSIDKVKSNLHQIRTLETLRDTLLPKLMSGEVRVNL